MYFIHPQIKLNLKNLKRIFKSFLGFYNKEQIEKVKNLFPNKQVVFTDMGRSAFKIIVEKLNLENTTMMLPAYICDIFYPIFKQYNIKPIFVDIDPKTFNLDIKKVRENITSEVKSIIVPHIYGKIANIDKIKEIREDLIIIEDASHAFGAKNLTNSDYLFFSLYKHFPCFRGGLLVCPKEWNIELPETKFSSRDILSFLNLFPFFSFFFKKFGNQIAPKMIKKDKKKKPAGINPISLNLFSYFSEDFKQKLKERKEKALYFQKKLKELNFQVQEPQNNTFCYFSALTPRNIDRDKLVQKLHQKNLFCTRIWHTPIVLNPNVEAEYDLFLGSYLYTIDTAQRIINFPLQNHYSKKDIDKMIKKIKDSLAEF
jgi:dTDP-4-amino-4,6-dideoxygalactose transaminase